MSIRFTNPKRKRVSCDVCDASMKVDASVDAMSDVIGGKFIKMTSSEAIPRHACVKCVRENRAEIKGSRSAEGAAEIFAAMNAELAAHDDPNAPDFMTPVESTAQNIIDGFEDFADDYGEGIPVVQAKKNRKHVVALGSKVCLTGKFAHGTRNEVQDELVREGYAKSSTAERADVVVKGDLEAPGWQSSKLRWRTQPSSHD